MEGGYNGCVQDDWITYSVAVALITPRPQIGTDVYGLPRSDPKNPSLPTESSAAVSLFASSFLEAEAWNCAAERRAGRAERRRVRREVNIFKLRAPECTAVINTGRRRAFLAQSVTTGLLVCGENALVSAGPELDSGSSTIMYCM